MSDEAMLVSPRNFSKMTGLPRDRVYALLRSGVIPHVRIGRRYMIPRTSAQQVIATLLHGGLAEPESAHPAP
jgi:excisionase family DNA binding protein